MPPKNTKRIRYNKDGTIDKRCSAYKQGDIYLKQDGTIDKRCRGYKQKRKTYKSKKKPAKSKGRSTIKTKGKYGRNGKCGCGPVYKHNGYTRPTRKYNINTKEIRRSTSKYTRDRIKDRQKGKCAMCKKKLGRSFDIDHKRELRHKGSNDLKNLQALCKPCHKKKTYCYA